MNDLNPDVRRLVDLARQARTPGADDKRRMAERLALPLAASAVIGTAAKAAGAKASSAALFGSLGAKLAAALALGAVATALVVSRGELKLNAPRAAHTPAPSAAAAPPAVSRMPVPQPEAAALPEAPSSQPILPKKPGTSHSAEKPLNELEQEAALLHQAQSAWRAGQSAEALRLANQHAQRFPRSQLANERDVLRVLSLCKLGQQKGAKQVGARLLRTAKGSPWYQSVADSCAAD